MAGHVFKPHIALRRGVWRVLWIKYPLRSSPAYCRELVPSSDVPRPLRSNKTATAAHTFAAKLNSTRSTVYHA